MEDINYKKLVDNNLNIDPREFANSVIDCYFLLNGSQDLTNLKLQKLMYYCYAFCCWNIEKIPFLPKENLAFYAFGGVFPAVYEELIVYGNSCIFTETLQGYRNSFLKKEVDKNTFNPDYEKYKINSKYKDVIIKSIKYLIILLINEDIHKLTRYTHSKSSAWHKIYKSNKILDNEQILKYIIEDLFNIKLVSKAISKPVGMKVNNIVTFNN